MDQRARQRMIRASQEQVLICGQQGYITSHACPYTCVIFRIPVERVGRTRMWMV